MKQSWLYVSLVILVSISALFLTSCPGWRASSSYHVLKITDGDTIEILYDNEATTVRYIGIDTPETHAGSKPIGEFGTAAADYNEQLISESGWQVDIVTRGHDWYGRLLAYVYTKDGKMINEEIIRNGLARPLTYENTSEHSEDFKRAYHEAYNNKRGIFSKYDLAEEVVDASIVKNNLTPFYNGGYLGKIIWLKFTPTDNDEYKYGYRLFSQDAIIELRYEEADLFFGGDPKFDEYKGKEVKVYGEIWEEGGKPKILLRAPFEIKVIE